MPATKLPTLILSSTRQRHPHERAGHGPFFSQQQERLRPLLVDIRKNTHSLSLKEACLFAEIK